MNRFQLKSELVVVHVTLRRRREKRMDRLHRRFTDEQIEFLFRAYIQCLLARVQVQEILGVGKTRFFALLKQY